MVHQYVPNWQEIQLNYSIKRKRNREKRCEKLLYRASIKRKIIKRLLAFMTSQHLLKPITHTYLSKNHLWQGFQSAEMILSLGKLWKLISQGHFRIKFNRGKKKKGLRAIRGSSRDQLPRRNGENSIREKIWKKRLRKLKLRINWWLHIIKLSSWERYDLVFT